MDEDAKKLLEKLIEEVTKLRITIENKQPAQFIPYYPPYPYTQPVPYPQYPWEISYGGSKQQ